MPNEHRPNQRTADKRNHRDLSEKDAARNEKPRTSVWDAVVFHRLAHCSQHTFACFLLVSRLAVGWICMCSLTVNGRIRPTCKMCTFPATNHMALDVQTVRINVFERKHI